MSDDHLFEGAVVVRQPRDGYRISADTILLGAFAAEAYSTPIPRLVDLGAGVGGVTLSLHRFRGVLHADLVEREPALAALARHNLSVSAIPGRVHPTDVATLPRALRGTARAVVCNPPYFEAEQGRPRQSPLSRAARSGELAPFLRAAAEALGRRARAFFVYPAPSLPRFLASAEAVGLVPKRLRFVHPFAPSPARVALVELARAKAGGLVVEAPLYEWASRGVRSEELTALLSGRAGDRTRSRPQRGR